MFELLTIAIFIWLLVKTVGLMLKLTWGAAMIIAGLLVAIAVPVLIVCLLFVGGVVLLVPLILIAIAAGIVKACL